MGHQPMYDNRIGLMRFKTLFIINRMTQMERPLMVQKPTANIH